VPPYASNLFFPNVAATAAAASGLLNSQQKPTSHHHGKSAASATVTGASQKPTHPSGHNTRSSSSHRDSSPSKKRLKSEHVSHSHSQGSSSRSSTSGRRTSPLEAILNSGTIHNTPFADKGVLRTGPLCAPDSTLAMQNWNSSLKRKAQATATDTIGPSNNLSTPFNFLPRELRTPHIDPNSNARILSLIGQNSGRFIGMPPNPQLINRNENMRNGNNIVVGNAEDESPDPPTSPEVDPSPTDVLRTDKRFAAAVEKHRREHSAFNFRMVTNPNSQSRSTRSKGKKSISSNAAPTKSMDEETTSEGDDMTNNNHSNGAGAHKSGTDESTSSISIQIPSFVWQHQGLLPPLTIMVPVPFPVPIPIPIPIPMPMLEFLQYQQQNRSNSNFNKNGDTGATKDEGEPIPSGSGTNIPPATDPTEEDGSNHNAPGSTKKGGRNETNNVDMTMDDTTVAGTVEIVTEEQDEIKSSERKNDDKESTGDVEMMIVEEQNQETESAENLNQSETKSKQAPCNRAQEEIVIDLSNENSTDTETE